MSHSVIVATVAKVGTKTKTDEMLSKDHRRIDHQIRNWLPLSQTTASNLKCWPPPAIFTNPRATQATSGICKDLAGPQGKAQYDLE
jgi:hypothetical protein